MLRKLVLSTALLVMIAQSALAEEELSAEAQKGFDIAARSDRMDRGFGDSTVDLKMVLRNHAGQESSRTLSIKTLEIIDESVGDKSIVVFDSPKDINGTALLSHAKILESDDQWLFLPALKRIKRISSTNKSGPFVGSEFAFEDFTALELNKFSYEYVGEEDLDGMKVDVVKRFPRYENSGYVKQIAYIDQDIYQVRKVEYYDRKDTLLKTLTLSGYKEYGNGIWRAETLAMVNHQNGKSSELIYDNYKFKVGLTDKDFVKNVLKRIR